MFITGRLWARSDDTYLLKRDSGQWEMIGVSMGLSEEQIQTIDIIKASAGGLSGTALGEKLNITTQSAWQRIEILIEKGFLVKRHGRACIKGTVP
jgi:DNA-binding MarR family transcriptional regulator